DQDPSDVTPTPTPVDWTGGVSVDQGAIGVKRTLKFDLHDSVDPRNAPNVVTFVSHTLPHVDGLLLKIVVPAGGSQTLHFDTAALGADIDLSQLDAKGGGRVDVDGRNGLAWIGF